MGPDEFANELWKCGSDPALLRARGFDESFIREEMDQFRFVRRKAKSVYNDELLELIECFNIPPTDIPGGIKFAQNIERMGDYYVVGQQEADPLLMNASTFEIHNADLFDLSFVMCKCALNGGRFLDAMIKVVQFFARHRNSDEKAQDEDAIATAALCARVAGGPEYLDFYKSILGCF